MVCERASGWKWDNILLFLRWERWQRSKFGRQKLINGSTEAQREEVTPIGTQRMSGNAEQNWSPPTLSSLLPPSAKPPCTGRLLRVQGTGPWQQKVHLTFWAKTGPKGTCSGVWGPGGQRPQISEFLGESPAVGQEDSIPLLPLRRLVGAHAAPADG